MKSNSRSSSSSGRRAPTSRLAELHAQRLRPAPPRAGCRRRAACTRPRRRCSARPAAGGCRRPSPHSPCRRSSAAQASDAGPPPMQATFARAARPLERTGSFAPLRVESRPSRIAAAARSRSASCCSGASRRRLRTAHPPGTRASSSAPEYWHPESSAPSRADSPLAIFLMKRGTSMCVGQAAVHGASKQYRQRFASATADCESNAGCRSGKLLQIPRQRRVTLTPPAATAPARRQALVQQLDELVHVGSRRCSSAAISADHVAVHAALADQQAVLARRFHQHRGLRRGRGALVSRSSTSSIACSSPMPRTSPIDLVLAPSALPGAPRR